MTNSSTPPPASVPEPTSPLNSTMVGGGVGIPASVIIVWVLETFAHVTVPGTVAAALGAMLAAGTGYFHSSVTSK